MNFHKKQIIIIAFMILLLLIWFVKSIANEEINLNIHIIESNDKETFFISMFNSRNSDIKEIYATIEIYNIKEEIFAKAESQKYNIQGLSQTQTVTQLNTKNLEPGVYDTILILKYGEKTTEQKIKLNITQNNIEFIGITGKTIEIIQEDKFYKNKGILWILGIGIILIINIIALILLKRKIK